MAYANTVLLAIPNPIKTPSPVQETTDSKQHKQMLNIRHRPKARSGPAANPLEHGAGAPMEDDEADTWSLLLQMQGSVQQIDSNLTIHLII
ncbi:hypothetical protein NDU88_000126 [Pleurodeles waltl]|uniref:Uncharacterized protein n=1 Tax=Pleurodeles waltl TaxID=8319 RepID=A0AAV7VWH4_PLEWA|nr:hypothetical protein NDU88_000126 [Pleurodeles waltl]